MYFPLLNIFRLWLVAGLAVLYELRDGPQGQRFGRGELLHLQALHAQENWAEIRRQDSQQAVQS